MEGRPSTDVRHAMPTYVTSCCKLRNVIFVTNRLPYGRHLYYWASEASPPSRTTGTIFLVGECSALWASGSDPADASADVSMHTAHAGERTTQR